MGPKRKREPAAAPSSSPPTAAPSPSTDPLGPLLNGKLHRFPEFIQAATIYHTLHRDETSVTNLPKHFIVPDDEPAYPPHLHGLKLNTAAVRTHYKNGNLHPESVAALRAIHFVFDVNELKWTLKIRAFETYKALHGDLKIQQDFIVPANDDRWPRDTWGMRLGLAVRSMRQKTDMAPDRAAQLTAMGFVWNILEQSWETKLLALKTYKALHGDLLVPYSFKTPAPPHIDWPEATCNMKLGHAVHNLRQNVEDMPATRRALLNAIGFVWDCLELSWDTKLVALSQYKALFGDVVVPYSFRVPRNDAQWPMDCWDLKLGHAVHNLRQTGRLDMPAERRDQLDRLGFVWDGLDGSWDAKLVALRTYRHMCGHVDVPPLFKVPKAAPWPPETWELKLGAIVIALRHQRRELGDERRQTLDAMGFVWQPSTASSRRMSSALSTTTRRSNARIPSPPLPPAGSYPPQDSYYSQSQASYRHASQSQASQSQSFSQSQFPSRQWDVLLATLHTFRTLYGYTTVVPRDFVVPPHNEHWPPHTWHVQLGAWLDSVLQSSGDDLPLDVCMALGRLGVAVERSGQHRDARQHVLVQAMPGMESTDDRLTTMTTTILPRLPGLGERRGWRG
ncbi:Aste57867_18128 [Aphanomyces stellatus]|uniref:Aste57867_18128 protein n=1 Tax=Aphanomyces stellatus TaxID=120398 RepID=A0A485L9A5_9STRA|nr:hypothetical protein As57867_018066 [Aphanomyces stellatus]VFT94866.1 Aste57867_18128 [Aphanomyces stellatus]